MPRIALLLFLIALRVDAATNLIVTRDGFPTTDAEVCWFPAWDRENPFKRWLASQELTCRPAAVVEFPPSLVNVFARSRDAVSRVPLTIDGAKAPASLTLTLEPAATLRIALPHSTTGVVYATRSAIAYPASPSLLVPADEELWLFVLEGGQATALFPIPAAEAASERFVNATSVAPSAVLGWLRVPERDRAAIESVKGLAPPVVRTTSGPESRTSDPLPPFSLLNGAFVRVRNVPAGTGTLTLSGRGWLSHHVGFNVKSGLTVVDEPLEVNVASTLVIHWSVPPDALELETSLGSCERPKTPRIEVTVASCPQFRPAQPPPECSPLTQETFAAGREYGSFAVEDVAPGTYRIELRFGKLPTTSQIVTVAPLELKDVRISAFYREAYGSVTLGGNPLGEGATIEFPAGYGFAVANSGEYRAALLNLLGIDAKVTVTACDGEPRILALTSEPMRHATRYDIDIPENELIVAVSDTFTRQPLDGATVKFVAMSMRVPLRPVLTETRVARENENGEAVVTMKSVPEREIRLTVSRPGYATQAIDPFTMPESGVKRIDVQLVPLRGGTGQIVSPTPFDRGAIYWFSPSGFQTERVDIAPDGTFFYERTHQAGETMTVASASHPLWTFRGPAMDLKRPITIRFPTAPARDVDVIVGEGHARGSRHIGLSIGGVIVPQPALREHQTVRQESSILRTPPLHLRAILETGPIDVLLGPLDIEVSTRANAMNLFALPQYAGVPRKRLATGVKVVRFDSE